MIKYTREQFSVSANEVVDSITKTDSKAYWSLPQALPIFNDFRVSLISCSIIINSDKNELVLGVTDGVLQYHQQTNISYTKLCRQGYGKGNLQTYL
jgi:hypothetical protein